MVAFEYISNSCGMYANGNEIINSKFTYVEKNTILFCVNTIENNNGNNGSHVIMVCARMCDAYVRTVEMLKQTTNKFCEITQKLITVYDDCI